MKKYLNFQWVSIFIIFIFISCSDDNKEPTPPPGPVYVDGINTIPEKAEATSELEIVFKAASTSPLFGHTGDVYAHIGYVEGSTWTGAPAWDENLAKYKMAKIEENVWSLTLSPDIRTWFGVPAGTPVNKIGVVFRSADGKTQEADMFIPVEDNTFSPGETVYESQPNNTIHGINIVDDTTVTLVLYEQDKNGEHKDYVYVIGDFNEWKIDNKYQMKRDRATGCWWLTLTGLDSGTDYAFQYYVGSKADGAIRVADPYTEKVLDPQDEHIPASTYPGLRAYPADKTSDIVSTFVIKPDEYSWKVKEFEIADRGNLVIYEMLFRDFTESGDIQGAMAKLPYLKSLGVNAIELMPVQEFDGNDSWGYNPCFFFAMDKAYGTKESYKRFIDECHSQGIAVILDVVYNHATGSNPFAKLYWNSQSNKTAANNPWFNVDAPHPYSVFHDFNHESELVRTFVKRNLKFLLREYNIDGFRFDLTKGFTQKSSNENTASNYDASRIEILKDYNQAIIDTKPDAIVILEHFAELREEKVLAEDGMKLWRNLNDAYCQSAMGYVERSSFESLYTSTSMPFGSWVGYMESHDEERAGFKQTEWGDGDLKTNLTKRMKQLEVNAAFFFTVPGPKMVWQFGELGYDISIDQNGRTGKKPVLWNYYEQNERKELYNTYSKLINLRLDNPELFTPSITFNWEVKNSNWANGRFITSVSGDKAMVVAGNFTAGEGSYSVTFPTTGQWYNAMDGTSLQVTSTTQEIKIPAHEFRLYVNFKP